MSAWILSRTVLSRKSKRPKYPEFPSGRSGKFTWSSLPHTGIVRGPWAATSSRPSMTSYTRCVGKTPPFFFASIVKFAGFVGSVCDFGPSPFPLNPWQVAQFDWNSCLPRSVLVSVIAAHPASTQERHAANPIIIAGVFIACTVGS